MTLILSGTNGVSDIDGDASTPAIRGTDANTGMFFGADQVGIATNGVERVEFGNSETVFNDGGANFDFRVEGDTDANLLFVDASADKVGIGMTNPGFKLDITDATTTTEAGGIRLTLGSEGRSHLITNATPNPSAGRDLGILAWRDLTLEAGNGTTEGVARLNSYEYTTFGTGSSYTERARITSGGEFCINIGSATAGARLAIKGSGSTSATYNIYSTNSANGIVFATEDGGTIYTGTLGGSPYNNTTASAANMFVTSGGVLQRSTSSLKYKTNVQNAVHGLTEVLKLRAVTYEGKADSDAGKTFGGLIAEEVHAAGLSEFVAYNEDGEPDALHYGHMVSLAFKAIQELKAELDTVKAELAALKGQ